MNIIFSRKGFDSSFGGCPSPVRVDTREMMSFPIPAASSPATFANIQSPWGPLGPIAAALGNRPALSKAPAHLDPDLDPKSRPRKSEWRGSLGQVDAAQGHLNNHQVGVGDVFVFFGWFKDANLHNTPPAFVRGIPDVHRIFGYLQVGEVLNLGAKPDIKSILKTHPWLHDHPHCHGVRSENNTLYLGSSSLILDGVDTKLPGYGAFPYAHPDHVLTAPGASKSVWRVPEWLTPAAGVSALSYHADPSRWFQDDEGRNCLRTVAKGQEFVFNAGTHKPALSWLEQLARTGMGPAPSIIPLADLSGLSSERQSRVSGQPPGPVRSARLF